MNLSYSQTTNKKEKKILIRNEIKNEICALLSKCVGEDKELVKDRFLNDVPKKFWKELSHVDMPGGVPSFYDSHFKQISRTGLYENLCHQIKQIYAKRDFLGLVEKMKEVKSPIRVPKNTIIIIEETNCYPCGNKDSVSDRGKIASRFCKMEEYTLDAIKEVDLSQKGSYRIGNHIIEIGASGVYTIYRLVKIPKTVWGIKKDFSNGVYRETLKKASDQYKRIA